VLREARFSRMAADDPARGSNRGDIKSRATHVDTFGDALSDEGSIPSASIHAARADP